MQMELDAATRGRCPQWGIRDFLRTDLLRPLAPRQSAQLCVARPQPATLRGLARGDVLSGSAHRADRMQARVTAQQALRAAKWRS